MFLSLFIRILILCLPIMFYINIGTKINISIADFVLPLIFFYQLIYHKDTGISKEKPILIYTFIIIFVMFLSLLVSSYSNNLNNMISGITNILKIIINFTYAIVIIKFLNESDKNDFIFLKTWSVTATVFSILGISGVTSYYFGRNTSFTLEYRLDGTFNDPNLAALYLYTSLIFNQIYCYKYLKRNININSIIIFLALILTVSRGGVLSFIIGTFISILFYFPQLNIKKILYILLIFSGLMLFVFLANNFLNNDLINTVITRLQDINAADNDTRYRFLLWDTAIKLWTKNPLIGAGLGQYSTVASSFLGYKITDIPHNTYLGFLAEVGIIGLFAIAWLPLNLLIKLKKTMNRGDIVSLFLFIGLMSMCIQAFAINIENIRFLWIFFAYILYWNNQLKM